MKRYEQSTRGLFPYYGVTSLWLLLIVLQQSGKSTLAMVLSIGIFALIWVMIPDHAPDQCRPTIRTYPKSDFNQVLQKGTTAILDLGWTTEQIRNHKVREIIAQLEQLSKKILNEAEECPEKLPKIETFVDYYLPTTLNILNAYRRAEAAGIEGENIKRTKCQIETMLDTCILVIFNKQLDSLFGSDALDISLELSVLESMMIQEGIAGEKLEAETTKNADGSDIKLML